MLTQLSVRNFTLVKSLDIEFQAGMTAITGETGAGKSILLNALGLTLGDRADYGQIRNGETRADVHAIFDINQNSDLRQFLKQHELQESGESEQECILRRTINANGTSKAWINGQPVNLGLLRQVAQLLINIHSQHEHQKLVNVDHQLALLDGYGSHQNSSYLELLKSTARAYESWHTEARRLTEIESDLDAAQERRDLLRFQVAELAELAMQINEYEMLEKEQEQLANAEAILTALHQLAQRISDADDFNLLSAINDASNVAESISAQITELDNARELLANAKIQIEEARDSVRHAKDRVEMNPERLAVVESRISRAFELARKYRVSPSDLPGLYDRLNEELDSLDQSVGDIDVLRENVTNLEMDYRKFARELGRSRKTAASKLSSEVNQYLQKLNMTGAEFGADITGRSPSVNGDDAVQFQITTNPGAPKKPIGKIVSGGELSRISLAIQVVASQKSRHDTLVFDEVDVGIGGETATVVGSLLNKLGKNAQVICVTHLAQVASQAQHQMAVSKSTFGNETETSIYVVKEDDRVKEIARMVGGAKQSDQSLAHAQELLKN